MVITAIRQTVWKGPLLGVFSGEAPRNQAALVRAGADEVVSSSAVPEVLVSKVLRLLHAGSPCKSMPINAAMSPGRDDFLGESKAFRTLMSDIPNIAQTDAAVMITGETGTGKEVLAKTIHAMSRRACAPFVPVQCGALPPDLVENELYGHIAGAFTGAVPARSGVVFEAEGGTLFLDEVDTLPPLSQVKLLRLLQEKEYKPLGSSVMRKADIRVISASNADLYCAVLSGKFRQDLFYRLNVVPLHIPPLRERIDDIPLLACHFLRKYGRLYARPARGFTSEAVQKLTQFDWPGNIRELEHTIERAVVYAKEETIGEELLEIDVPDCSEVTSFRSAKVREIEEFEKRYIEKVLRESGGNISEAARIAQMNRRAFWQAITKYGIKAEQYKAE
jgi:DNA-binding NtrC family response regulator